MWRKLLRVLNEYLSGGYVIQSASMSSSHGQSSNVASHIDMNDANGADVPLIGGASVPSNSHMHNKKQGYLGDASLDQNAFAQVLSFLSPKDLVKMRAVARKEKNFIDNFAMSRRLDKDGGEAFNLPRASLNMMVACQTPVLKKRKKLHASLASSILLTIGSMLMLGCLPFALLSPYISGSIVVVCAAASLLLLIGLVISTRSDSFLLTVMCIIAGVISASPVLLPIAIFTPILSDFAFYLTVITFSIIILTIFMCLGVLLAVVSASEIEEPLSLSNGFDAKLERLWEYHNEPSTTEYPEGIENEQRFLIDTALHQGLLREPIPSAVAAEGSVIDDDAIQPTHSQFHSGCKF